MKGIILAGGSGTRLYPLTRPITKQLLPVYDKPMIYYSLSTLMLAGIRDILIISTPEDTPRFESVLGSGRELGISLSYKVQPNPGGIAQAFLLGEDFIGNDSVCLILGDNIFFGHGFVELLEDAYILTSDRGRPVIFAYYVNDPQRYGIVEFGEGGRPVEIIEKPKEPRSNYAVTGLYFYTNDVVEIAKGLQPSTRGELEITDVNREYLKRGVLDVQVMGRGYAWLDTGTFESLFNASQYIKTIEDRQGLKIGCIEEVAYKKGFISAEGFGKLISSYNDSGYKKYLSRILEQEPF